MTEMEVQDGILKEKIIAWERIHDNIKHLLAEGEKVCEEAKQLQEVMGVIRMHLDGMVTQGSNGTKHETN